MTKKAKIWLFTILAPVILIYFFSPPRNLIIQINAKPQGVEEFYVEITSSKANFHGTTVKNVAKQLVPSNQKINIPLDRNKTLWFGRLMVSVYHPEYYQEMVSASNNYMLPSATLSPTTWMKILSSEEKLLSQQVYRSGVLSYQDIPMSHINYHLWFIKKYD